MSDSTVSNFAWCEDWPTTTLGEIGAIYSGSTPSRGVPGFWGGNIPWVTPGELTSLGEKYLTGTRENITRAGRASCAATLVPKDSLLVTTRATLGAVALAAMPVTTNQGFRSIVFKGSAAPHFFYHLASRLVPELIRRASGTTFLEISGREFAAVAVPLPPLPEQRRIAEIVDTLDEAIRKTEQIVAKLQQMKQGLLHDLLTRGIDEHGELRDPDRHPEQFKDSPLGRVPSEWEVPRLGEVVQRTGGVIQTGPFGSQLHAHEYVRDGVPVVMPQDIRGDSIDVTNIARITEQRARELARHRVQPNDAVFSRRGDLSRCVAVTEKHVGWLCGTGCLLVRAAGSALTSEWLTSVYRHDLGQRQVLAQAVGSTMVNLNGKILSNLRIPVPSLAEQSAASERVFESRNRIISEQDCLQKLRDLKHGLMDDLLTGRVRVAVAESEKATA
jgi:type I restriction enzyme S subunit